MESYNSTFTATGQSSVANGDICDVILSGTFVGTVDFEVQDAVGNWVSYDSWTTPAQSLNNEAAFARNWRLNCTSYTSGDIGYELSAGRSRELKG
ncbi:MAG: hypothetical protein GY749_22745 [Desulfobacteraceae bacterium]|nr:hypothetical protein [Desulfobacteraceae bacterium]